MLAVTHATGLVMLSGWALVLLGAALLRDAAPGLARRRGAAAAVTLAGLVTSVVARVVV